MFSHRYYSAPFSAGHYSHAISIPVLFNLGFDLSD
jgi:hypothetical protein